MISYLKIIAFFAMTSGSFAQAEDKKPTEEPAVQAFGEGQALFEKGEYLRAAVAFDRAYQLRPHPLVLGNLGHCYDAAGDYPKAVEVFRKYLERPDMDNPAFNKTISRRLKALHSKVGDLRITCRRIRCSITVAGVPRGIAPVDLVLLAGVHSVEVEDVDGALKRQYEVNVRGAGETLLDVNLADSPTSGPPEAAMPQSTDSSESSGGLSAAFWVATSATVLGIGAVSVLGALNLENQDEFRQGGSTDVDLQKRGQSLNLATNIAIGLTCATATTALILGIIELKHRPDRKKKQRGAALTPMFNLAPIIGPFVGVSVRLP